MTPAQALSAKLRARQRRVLSRKWASWPTRDTPIDLSGLSKAELRAYCERIAADAIPKIIADWNRPSPLAELTRKLGL